MLLIGSVAHGAGYVWLVCADSYVQLMKGDKVLRQTFFVIPLYTLCTFHVTWLVLPCWEEQGLSLLVFGALRFAQSLTVGVAAGVVGYRPVFHSVPLLRPVPGDQCCSRQNGLPHEPCEQRLCINMVHMRRLLWCGRTGLVLTCAPC